MASKEGGNYFSKRRMTSISTKSDDPTTKETSLVSTYNNQIVPYECIVQNHNVPTDNYMMTFQMKNPNLNHQIDNCINFNNTSPSDIVLLKQYICVDFKQTFKLPEETLEEATNRCFKKGMFFYSVYHSREIIHPFGLEWGF